METTDKGLSWTLVTRDVSHGSFSAVKIDPTNEQIVYAGTSGKLIKSTNQGNKLDYLYSESGLWFTKLPISSTNPSIVILATNKGVIRSTNGGSTWTKLFTNETWTIKAKKDRYYIFAIRDNGTTSDFIKSIDSGATWSASNTGGGHRLQEKP